jgi:predicted nucleotidyltransferase component of viral defense system
MEYLLEEAKDLGLPLGKKRAVVREYVQNILLSSIYRAREGRGLYFMGGTALRFCYRLPRFSEDLDFNAHGLSYEGFQNIASDATTGARLVGLHANTTYERRDTLFTARVVFPSIMRQYGVTDQRGIDLVVKLEVNQPDWQLNTQAMVLSYYGMNYTATVMAQSSLITEKLLALLSRSRGRDVYDLLFMLKKRFPFDREILKKNGFEETPEELIMRHLERLEPKELQRLSKQVQPFLFKEEEIEMIEKSPEYAKKFLESY